MANVLMPVKFHFLTLFEGLISISDISPITTKIQIWYLEVMILKGIEIFFGTCCYTREIMQINYVKSR